MSSYKEGQVHQLMDSLEGDGYTPTHLTQIRQSPTLRRDFLGVLKGTHEVVPITRSADANASTPTAWTVDDEGNIHFTLTSNGLTPEQWEWYLESRDLRLSDFARGVLRRASEAPTNGVAYHIVVHPSSKVRLSERVTKKIRAHATEKGWKTPHWEVACLIRDTFTDEQLDNMDLWWIVTMHEPIEDSGGCPRLLDSSRSGGGRLLDADVPDGEWLGGGGFAFAVPQVSPQS